MNWRTKALSCLFLKWRRGSKRIHQAKSRHRRHASILQVLLVASSCKIKGIQHRCRHYYTLVIQYSYNLPKFPHLPDISILIEDHKGVLQHRLYNASLRALVTSLPQSHSTHHHGRCKADGQALRGHAVAFVMFLDTRQVQHDGAYGGVVGVGQSVDDSVYGIAASGGVINICTLLAPKADEDFETDRKRTRRINELLIMLGREQRVWQVSEEGLQQTGTAIDVMKESFRISEIDLATVVIEACFQLSNVILVAVGAVDAFRIEPEKVDSLNALIHDKRHGRVVTAKELIELHSEHTIVRL